jgi:hypothetical protein
MVQIDVPIAFAVGGLFADAANRQIATGRAEYYFRAFSANILFQIFFFSWIPVYFLLNYFGWETTHMWWKADSVNDYPYYLPIFLVVFFGAAILGFLLGASLVRKGRLGTNRVIYLGTVAYAAIWIFGQLNRSAKLGTWQQWHDNPGSTPWFYQDQTFLIALIGTIVVWAGGMTVLALRLWNEGKHIDPIARAAVGGR